MSQLPNSDAAPMPDAQTQQVHTGTGDNVSQDKNVTSYLSEIGGDVKGFVGHISGGVINQYIIAQKSGFEIRSQRLITGSPYLGLRKFEARAIALILYKLYLTKGALNGLKVD